MLRVQQEEYQREKITALQAQLEESHKTRSEMDTENRFTQRACLCERQQQNDVMPDVMFSLPEPRCCFSVVNVQAESRTDQ